MSWDRIIGHAAPITRLRAAIAASRLHPALLFEGPEGIGKKRVALTLAKALSCPRARARGGDPCGECRVCLSIAASADPEVAAENQSQHPGVRVVSLSRPDERELRFGGATSRGEIRSQITVPQIRVVLSEVLARGSSGGPRVVIVDPADRMGESAANALLKTLEEPPRAEYFVLITSKASALLPTILSRCCRFRFGLLSEGEILSALVAAGDVPGSRGGAQASAPAAVDRAAAASAGGRSGPVRQGADRSAGGRQGVDLGLIASLAGGRVGRALELAEGPSLKIFYETRNFLLESLESLARGVPAGTFAVVAGASFRAREREEWREAIGTLEMLLRDLAVLAVDGTADVANTDVRDRLLPLASPLGARAARALARLDSVRSDLRVNVNGRLAAERILIEVGR